MASAIFCDGIGQKMNNFFLGVDVGSTKTEAAVADSSGNILGRGLTGAGNHENVGYDGLTRAIADSVTLACREAGIRMQDLCAGGFGVSGYDWPCELPDTVAAIRATGLDMPIRVVNDTIIGLVAGAESGWGIGVVAGTGCNCWGWDREHSKIGRVAGRSLLAGDHAGSSELVEEMMRVITREWTMAGPKTVLTRKVMEMKQEFDLGSLLEHYYNEENYINASFAPMIFDTAIEGDPEAVHLVNWAAEGLADMVRAVTLQLGFEKLAFDIVLIGSMFKAGEILLGPMQEAVWKFAPEARFVRLEVPPVAGALKIGMETGGIVFTTELHKRLLQKERNE